MNFHETPEQKFNFILLNAQNVAAQGLMHQNELDEFELRFCCNNFNRLGRKMSQRDLEPVERHKQDISHIYFTQSVRVSHFQTKPSGWYRLLHMHTFQVERLRTQLIIIDY